MTNSPFIPVTPLTVPVAIVVPNSSASDCTVAMPAGKHETGQVKDRDQLYGAALAEAMSHMLALNKQITQSAIGNMNLQCLQAVIAHMMNQQNSTPEQLLAMLQTLENSIGGSDPAMSSFLQAQIANLKGHISYEHHLNGDIAAKIREAARLKKEEADPANQKDPVKEKKLKAERAKVEAEIAHDKAAVRTDKATTMTQAENSIEQFISGAKIDSDADTKMLDQATKSDSGLVNVFKTVGYFGFSSKTHDNLEARSTSQDKESLKAKEKSQDIHKTENKENSQPETAKGIFTHFSFTHVSHYG